MSGTVKHVGCDVTGCDEPHRALGLCRRHYTRQNRHGSPHILLVPTPAKPGAKEPHHLRPGQRVQDAIISTPPTGGTVTLEEWKRLRATPAADVHIVQRQKNATGIVA